MAIGMLGRAGRGAGFPPRAGAADGARVHRAAPRPALHRLALELLSPWPATRDDLARLAHHAEAAGDRDAVREYAPAAARRAAAVSAHREAASLYALALRYADELPAEERALLLEAYARECNITERRPEGIAARREALELWRALETRIGRARTVADDGYAPWPGGTPPRPSGSAGRRIELLEGAAAEPRAGDWPTGTQAGLRMLNRDLDEAIAGASRLSRWPSASRITTNAPVPIT